MKLSYSTSPVGDHGLRLELQKLRDDYNSVFWSSIWYFSAKGLPLDLFLPYYYPKYDKNNSSDVKLNDVSFRNLEVDQSVNCEIPSGKEDYSQLSYRTNGYEIKEEITLERKESRTKSMDNFKPDNYNL